MDKRSDKTVPTWYLILLLKEVLLGNIFEFNDKLYSQQIVTTMGTVLAPCYANLFMGWLEQERLLGNWKGTPPKHTTTPLEPLY